ncbi:AP-5 complex subunit mu-1-like [Clytia hemisphaerica]|uniref:AP-5 complex subunit mu-1 n=1 Tax=Clytia hemisphaerica TaxID=252671 RepID=A0A7M5VE70_9CNID
MSFRAIYIIKPTTRFPENILFHRSFPVIERKCKKSLGDDYVPIPPNCPLLIIEALQLNRTDKFVADLDSCSRKQITPVYKLLDGKLFPVVAFLKNGLIFCCIPHTEEKVNKTLLEGEKNEDRCDFLYSPGVALAFALIQNMSKFIGFGNNYETLQNKLQTLHKYASIGFPLGIPTELDIHTALGIASYSENIPLPKIKGPSWRATTYKGKQSLNIEINEFIKAIQFDSKEYPDVCEIYGTVRCKADVEESPEISLDIIAPLESTIHNQMLFHPSVQLADDVTPLINKGANTGRQYGSRKLRFCPPNNEIDLCQYKVKLHEDDIPVKAFYQMKGDQNRLTIMIQIQIAEQMKSSFEAFEVQIPFFNRGPIVEFKSLTSSNLVLLPDKCTLLWNVGHKFSSKGGDKIWKRT